MSISDAEHLAEIKLRIKREDEIARLTKVIDGLSIDSIDTCHTDPATTVTTFYPLESKP